MARTEARVKSRIWQDDDWRKLDPLAQWSYLCLLSQPDLSSAGVLTVSTRRLSAMSEGLTESALVAALGRLEDARFIGWDRDTDEVALRTFVRNDDVVKVPGVRKSMWSALVAIHSDGLRTMVASEIPVDAREMWRSDGLRNGVLTGVGAIMSAIPSAIGGATPGAMGGGVGVGIGVGDISTVSEVPTSGKPDFFASGRSARSVSSSFGSPPETEPDPVRRIFDAWQESTGKQRAKLDEKRRRVIRKALADYPVEDVVAAVRGWKHSPHNRGENERGMVYNDLSLLLRDADHIERFRDLERSGGRRKPGTLGGFNPAINRAGLR